MTSSNTDAALANVRVVVSGEPAVADDALRLAHDGAVERGFMNPTPNGRRVEPALLNDGTRFIVAYAGDEAVAAATLVDDGPHALPSQTAFAPEIDDLRTRCTSITEVSGLVVVPSWRHHHQLGLGFIVGTVVRLNGRRGRGHRVMFSVEPRQARFMFATLMGEERYGPRDFMGAPACLIVTGDCGRWTAFFGATPAPAARKMMGRYALGPDPDWLDVRDASDEWRTALLPTYAAEADVPEGVQREHSASAQGRVLPALGNPAPG